ncbi:MAG: hypothetical protein ACRDU9_03955 [Acidimicrobiia bacterium]
MDLEPRMRRRRRRIVRLHAAIAVALVLGGCGGGSQGAGSATNEPTSTTAATTETPVSGHRPNSPAAHAEFDGLSFDYPTEWTSQPFGVVSSFSDVITYLSPMRLHDPCIRTSVPSGEEISCGYPVTQLDPGTVLVTWTRIGFPHSADQPAVPQPNTTIGGRQARINAATPGDCAGIGGDETIVADIERPNGNYYEMHACLRGPGLNEMEQAIIQMLDSTKVTA